MKWSLIAVAVAALAVLACAAVRPARALDTPTDAEHYLAQFIDSTASPRTDFFQWSVGGWLKRHPIPASETSWGIGHVVQEETYQRLIGINHDAAASHAAPGSNAQKIGDFWQAAMDSDAIAKRGYAPLKGEFARIDAIKDLAGVLSVASHLQYIGVDAFFGLGIQQDEMNSDAYSLHVWQGGLGLPERDFYFDTSKKSLEIRREYVKHVGRMLELLGDAPAKATAGAATVMTIETALAKVSRKIEDLRDPHANYNPMSVDSAGRLTPAIRWKAFLDGQNIHGVDTLVVGQPEFLKGVQKLLRTRTVAEWKTYLRWHLANAFASEAGGKFDAEDFHFYGQIMNGRQAQRPRWKRALDWEEGYLGDALGQLYVQRYFGPETRERYRRLADDIFAAFRERVGKLEWMTPPTKERAVKKLAAVTKKVGYPDKWRDYSTFEVKPDDFIGNCLRGNVWRSEYYIHKLGHPVDRTEWDMTPQTYNAYYNPSNNEIVLPAAAFILPGIPDSLVDDALVYGYAGGSTIGHELTHGFDDEGHQFDEKGNLKDWWTDADGKEFNHRVEGIVNQFNGYVAVDTLHINGKATAGENIADLGGIWLGWDAFKKTAEYRDGKSIGGLTPAQRYFMGWAVSWMRQIRRENLIVRVKTDVHSPDFLRVNGPCSNLPPFYEAFGVKPGDRMYRSDADRVVIW